MAPKTLLATALAVFVLFQLTEARSAKQACLAVKRCLKRLDDGKRCKILPVPDSAAHRPLTSPFELKQLRKDVWEYHDGFYQTLIIRHGFRLVMVDVPAASSSKKEDGSKTKLTDAAERVMAGTAPKHIDIIYSHEHFDHIGATNLFVNYMKEKYPSVTFDFWGTLSAVEVIKNTAEKRAPIPNKIVGSSGAKLSLRKDLEIDIAIVGGHAQEDLRIYIPPYKSAPGIVMYVDVVFPKYVTTVNIGITENLRQTLRAQKEILKLDFKYLIAGHFFSGTKKDMQLNLEYTEDLIEAAQEALDTVGDKDFMEAGLANFSDPKAREFGNLHFLTITTTRNVQSRRCQRIMLEKWGCRLYGIDIVGEGHCLTAIINILAEL